MVAFLDEPVGLSTFFPIEPARGVWLVDSDKVRSVFSGYVTISEDATDTLEITQHPVQQGAAITDHAYMKPAELKIRLVVGALAKPLSESYDQLLKLQFQRIPLRVITGKRTYNNMLIKSVDQTTDKTTENILSVSLSLMEVIIVEVTPVVVPSRPKQKHPAKTGATEKKGKESLFFEGKETGGKFIDGVKNFFGGVHL